MSTLGEKNRVYVLSEGVARACGRASTLISPLFTWIVGLQSGKLLGILSANVRYLTE